MAPLPRRRFLAQAGAAALAGVPALRVPAIEAMPTVFHGHPDATRTLVRFVVRNSDAPAGRMRVYDERSNQLLGTAGVLPAGENRLVGELWLPLERRIRIRTEFEYPGTRQPLRDRFTLEPTPRWTLHWLLLAHPAAVRGRLARVHPLLRGSETLLLGEAGVQLDPVREADPLTDLEAMRIAAPAFDISRTTGVPLAPLGSAVRGFPALPRVLAASGLVGVAGLLEEPWTVLEAAPVSVGALQQLVEQRLVATETPDHRAIVVVPVTDGLPALSGVLDAWAQRYVAPAITLGRAPEGMRVRAGGLPPAPLPDGTRGLARHAASRTPLLARERMEAFDTLARRLGGVGDPLATIAGAIAYPVPGRMVFNPAPWGRTDAVELPDGTTRHATSVPGHGYAFLPDAPGTTWSDPAPVGAMATIAAGRWRVRVDGRGAIDALVHLPTGTDLAGPGGLLAVEHARAEGFTLARAESLGERLSYIVHADGLSWRTTITVYDAMDVVDVATTGGPWDGGWRLDPAVGGTRVRFAQPLGEGLAEAAFGPVACGEWLSADGEFGSLMVTLPDGALLTRRPDGPIRCVRPEGPARFRLTFARPALPEDPWRAGALASPFLVREAPGTGRSALPTFGSLLEVGDPGVRLVAIRGAADGAGLIAYLHDLMGFARPVPLTAGLLTFRSAFACDLLERDREPLEARDGTVMVPMTEAGLAAVRLLGG